MKDPTLTYLAEQLRPAAEPATQTITLWAHRYPIERVMVEGGAKPYLYAEKQADDDVPFSFVVGVVAEADPLQGMSEINRAVAYSAAAKLRQLGYEWTGGEWAAPAAAPEPGAWRMIDKHGDSVHAPRAPTAAPGPIATVVLGKQPHNYGLADVEWHCVPRVGSLLYAHRPQKPLPEYQILHLLDLEMARLSGPPRSAGDVVVAVVRAIEALPTQE